jgi:hypothetical protein
MLRHMAGAYLPPAQAKAGVRRIHGLRTPLALIALGLALALAACGGASEQSSDEQLIPRALASDLAAKSDAIAGAIDAGDVCGAAQLADELKDAVDIAISGGQIPPAYQRDLEEAATELQNEVNCEQPEQKDEGKDKGNDKGKKHDEQDETTTVDATIPTTTED